MIEPARDIPRIQHMLEAIANALEYTQSFKNELSDGSLTHKKPKSYETNYHY